MFLYKITVDWAESGHKRCSETLVAAPTAAEAISYHIADEFSPKVQVNKVVTECVGSVSAIQCHGEKYFDQLVEEVTRMLDTESLGTPWPKGSLSWGSLLNGDSDEQ